MSEPEILSAEAFAAEAQDALLALERRRRLYRLDTDAAAGRAVDAVEHAELRAAVEQEHDLITRHVLRPLPREVLEWPGLDGAQTPVPAGDPVASRLLPMLDEVEKSSGPIRR